MVCFVLQSWHPLFPADSHSPGDVMYFSAMGQPIVILNSWKSAHELLALRSSIYSGRPKLQMAGELSVDPITGRFQYNY